MNDQDPAIVKANTLENAVDPSLGHRGPQGASAPKTTAAAQPEATTLAPAMLPQEMRALVRDLNALIDDYHARVKEITRPRDATRAQASQRLETEQKQLTETKTNLAKILNDQVAHAKTLEANLEQGHQQALAHLQQQSVSVPYFPTQARQSSNPGQHSLASAQQHISSAEAALRQMRGITKPDNATDIFKGFGWGGFFVGLIAGIIAGSAWFWLILIVSLGIATLIVVTRESSASSAMTAQFGIGIEQKSLAELHLNDFRQYCAAEHERASNSADARYGGAQQEYQRALAAADLAYTSELKRYQARLRPEVGRARLRCVAFQKSTAYAGINWSDESWKEWQPAISPTFSACLGTLVTPAVEMLQPFFSDTSLEFSVPAMLPFADGQDGRCLLIKATGGAKEEATKAIQSVMLRLLANIPPGKVLFTLLDPVGLGQSVAAFMPLADYEEKLITSRAWTEPQHIEEQLSKITEHMENVIQKYLRNDYRTIEEYNKKAGEVAEPYRVLVALDFPTNFSENAARRLVSISRNGPRCGVYTLIVMDTDPSKKLPYGFNLADLEQSANVLYRNGERFIWHDKDFDRHAIALDQPPTSEHFNQIIKETGLRSKDAMKVEVPFNKLLSYAGISEDSLWEATTHDMIHVPLGPKGAQKLQYLTFGKGTEHHAVVIGMPGSGKSNLMHIIITSMAMMYSPEEVQLYLIDFKQGVEFKRYAQARLPHAKVIAIESEREFGLSVLKGLDEELHKRGENFRKMGVNAISEYRKNFPDEKLPRILLLVDEFQEFFSYDDNIGREANLLLDRLIRQGRYAGIHVMLGSQSLANRSSLPSSTLGQVGIRIALKCSESDARQIMADDNPQARLLSRPGEAIYNAASGLIEGNNFFQVALFTEEDRQARLDGIGQFANEVESSTGKSFDRPIIFEGNEPSRLEECVPITDLLARTDYSDPKKLKELWLGEPVSISPPTSAKLRRQGANNLLIVTRNEEEGIGMLASAIVGLAAQVHPENAKFSIVDLSTADSAWADLAEDLAAMLPHQIEVLGRRDMVGALNDLVNLVNRRIEGEKGEEIFFIVQGLHRARDLREEEARGRSSIFDREEKGPSAPELFSRLLREGPECGIHTLAWCDAYSNVKRTLGRSLNEFALRVAGAMSNDDSMGLLDDSAASKLDKPHRAIFFDDEKPGRLEKFRPYAIPEKDWLEQAAQTLHSRVSKRQTSLGA